MKLTLEHITKHWYAFRNCSQEGSRAVLGEATNMTGLIRTHQEKKVGKLERF